MAQHDGIIDNQAFPAFRADLNNAIQALLTQSSGTSAPGTTYPFQPWANSTTGVISVRNSGNTGWAKFAELNPSNLSGVFAASGLILVASQNATQTLTLNAYTTINFSTEDYDPHNRFSSGTFTVPVSGWYRITVSYRISFTGGTDNRVFVSVYVGGTITYLLDGDPVLPSNNLSAGSASAILNLLAGQTVTIRANPTSTAATAAQVDFQSGLIQNRLSIEYLPLAA